MVDDPKIGERSVTDSSGNVFADLDLPATEQDMLKVQIARAITNTIQRRKLTQVAAAKLLETDQAKISALCRGRLTGFTVERLMRYLAALGHDVEVRISPKLKGDNEGRILVRAACG